MSLFSLLRFQEFHNQSIYMNHEELTISFFCHRTHHTVLKREPQVEFWVNWPQNGRKAKVDLVWRKTLDRANSALMLPQNQTKLDKTPDDDCGMTGQTPDKSKRESIKEVLHHKSGLKNN